MSSLRRFASHPDERRRDEKEGRFGVLIVSDRDTNHSQSILTVAQVPANGYVLCASHIYYRPLADKFSANAAIEILDTTRFAGAIARALPNFRAGMEGTCIYRRSMLLERDIRGFDLNQQKNEKGELEVAQLIKWVSSQVGLDHFFLKRDLFVPEAEYRFVWMCTHAVDEHIDVIAPEAIQYCRRPRPLPE